MLSPLYDQGVLFVHGIGQQRAGETLIGCSEPLRAMLERLLTGQGARVSFSSARIKEQTDNSPAHAVLELQEIRIRGLSAPSATGMKRTSEWLLAEAWWAEEFPPPTFREIVNWAFRAVPWALISHGDRRFRRAVFRAAWVIEHSAGAVEIARALLRWLVEGLVLLSALALTIPLMIAVSALLVAGLIPIASIREVVGRLQRTLSAVIGDSYVLLQRPVIEAAIYERVRRDLEWLATRCRRVVVVAHSQGAAVAHEVLRRHPMLRCAQIITYGSGLAKLDELRRITDPAARRRIWIAALAVVATVGGLSSPVFLGHSWWLAATTAFQVVYLGSIFFLVHALTSSPRTTRNADLPRRSIAGSVFFVATACAWSAWVFWPVRESTAAAITAAFVGASGLAIAYRALAAWHSSSNRSLNVDEQWRFDRQLFHTRLEFKNDRIRWIDYYTTADPVPNGALLDDYQPERLFSMEVTNFGSTVLDHTSYWQSTNDFVVRVATDLLEIAGIVVEGRDIGRSGARRRWRVAWLVGGRWTIALCTLALAAAWSRTITLAPGFVRDWLEDLQLPGYRGGARFAGEGQPATESFGLLSVLRELGVIERDSDAIAAAAAVLLGTLVYFIVRLLWQGWDRRDTQCLLARGDYRLFPWQLQVSVATVMVYVALAALELTGSWRVTAMASVPLVAAAGIAVVRRARDWMNLVSQSGPPARLNRLHRERLERKLRKALIHKDADLLERLGRRLEWIAPDLAVDAWQTAMARGSRNAAWHLGWHLANRAARSDDVAEQARLRSESDAAWKRGADLDDPVSALSLAWSLEKAKRRAEADVAFERAFKLGSDSAAHSHGLRLEQAARHQEAIATFREGIGRGDPLSAVFLGNRLEREAQNARDAGRPADDLVAEAAALFKMAFDWGHIEAAADAGDVLRENGQFDQAWREYQRGIESGHARAAARLGRMAAEDLQDHQAARAAFEQAIQLDVNGSIAAEAHYGLGVLAEKEGRTKAAMHAYRAAMGKPGEPGHAKGALAVARLLESWKRSEIKAALLRAVTLSPDEGSEPLVDFLASTYDFAEAIAVAERGTKEFTADALYGLGHFLQQRTPSLAKELLQRALDEGSANAAVELYERAMTAGSTDEQIAVIEKVTAGKSWIAADVADKLEEKGHHAAAADLKARVAAREQAAAKKPEPQSSGV